MMDIATIIITIAMIIRIAMIVLGKIKCIPRGTEMTIITTTSVTLSTTIIKQQCNGRSKMDHCIMHNDAGSMSSHSYSSCTHFTFCNFFINSKSFSFAWSVKNNHLIIQSLTNPSKFISNQIVMVTFVTIPKRTRTSFMPSLLIW